MTHSRNKGKRGEWELVRLLRAEGFDARRGQQFRGTPESPEEEEEEGRRRRARQEESAGEAAMVFPVKGGGEWKLTEAKLAEYQATYPLMDLLPSLRRARQWLLDHPERRKSKRGMARYLGSWLARDQEAGRLQPLSDDQIPEPNWTRHDLRIDGRISKRRGYRYSAYFGEEVPAAEWKPFAELEAEMRTCAGEVFRG